MRTVASFQHPKEKEPEGSMRWKKKLMGAAGIEPASSAVLP